MASRFEDDLAHAQHATDLSLELFDALRPAHGLGEAEREILEAAGMLHNVGRFIAHAAHHKHSYYLIRHSEHLAGFTEQEIELIAQVARYHRKSNPRNKHEEFAALGPDEQQCVRVLAGLLRIAIALDRSGEATVSAMHAYARTFELAGVQRADAVLDLGAGTGYGSAILRQLVGETGVVAAVEVDPALVARAQALSPEDPAWIVAGDALDPSSWTCDPGRFDRVVVGFALPEVPPSWARVFRPGVVIVAPVAGGDGEVRLTRLVLRDDRTFEATPHEAVHYVRVRRPSEVAPPRVATAAPLASETRRLPVID